LQKKGHKPFGKKRNWETFKELGTPKENPTRINSEKFPIKN